MISRRMTWPQKRIVCGADPAMLEAVPGSPLRSRSAGPLRATRISPKRYRPGLRGAWPPCPPRGPKGVRQMAAWPRAALAVAGFTRRGDKHEKDSIGFDMRHGLRHRREKDEVCAGRRWGPAQR